MFSKTIIVATVAALFATSAIGAAVQPLERGILIAADPTLACNCPNNCKHKNGDSCKFYKDGNVIAGECQHSGDSLKCIA